jgi:UDP-galactopyranose mutase
MTVDYLVVGSGLTGGTIARHLADAGREVLIVDRRTHVGGNVHDHVHPSGIPIHTYGPHYFRTESLQIWEFANRFAHFHKFEAVLKAAVDGKYENWPVAASYIRRTVGENWTAEFHGRPANFEEASLAMMPRPIYEKFVKGYSEKQWGVPATRLSVKLAGRFDVRADDEARLKRHRFQGIPQPGYTAWMSALLGRIPTLLGWDFLHDRDAIRWRKALIFTGPIDEFFGFDLGRLVYRGQRRTHRYLPDVDFAQPVAQVNNPDPGGGPHIRTLEWKHLMPSEYGSRIRGTVLTTEVTETPTEPDRYEYPFPDDSNQNLYERYRQRADSLSDVIVCGRLGEYRYYDMDHAIGRAMNIAARLLGGGSSHRRGSPCPAA